MSPFKQRSDFESALKPVPMSKLETEDIGTYAGSALYTVGDELDYRYFLPRILDLASAGLPGYLGLQPWCIAQKLNYAHWDTWPRQEQEAILLFFSAAFYVSAVQGPSPEEWLDGLATLGQDLRPYFAVWNSNSSAKSLAQFASVVILMVDALNDRATARRYSHMLAMITPWVLDPKTMELLEIALGAVSEDEKWEVEAAIANIKRITR